MAQPVLNIVPESHGTEKPEAPEAGQAQQAPNEDRADDKPRREFRPKPRRPLPPDRISVTRQLELLRAYAAASGHGERPVHYEEAAGVAKMHRSTVSAATPFFTDVGLLTKVDGHLMPASEVLAYEQASHWGSSTAAERNLAPLMEKSWFFQALKPNLSFGPMQEQDALLKLSEVCGARQEYAQSLRMLIEYMETAGLIQREGSTLKLVNKGTARSHDAPPTTTTRTMPVQNVTPAHEPHRPQPEPEPPPRGEPSAQTATGGIHLSFDIRVTSAEIAAWHPDRITAFFAGLAQVLAAKKGESDT